MRDASLIELADYLDTARAIAEQAGHIIASNRRSMAERKFDGTLVTEIDKQVDALISAQLRQCYPQHAVLSEEADTVYNPNVEYTWVVDPLDGTTNFVRGLPICGVSIGLLRRGQPVLGALHFPVLQETYTALAGAGAHCNDKPIRVAENEVADDQHLLLSCTRTARYFRIQSPLKRRVLGSAAYDLCKLADGTALAVIQATPKIWNLAAAHLLVLEAGGHLKPIGNGTLFPLPSKQLDYRSRSIPVVAAASEGLLVDLLSHVTVILGAD